MSRCSKTFDWYCTYNSMYEPLHKQQLVHCFQSDGNLRLFGHLIQKPHAKLQTLLSIKSVLICNYHDCLYPSTSQHHFGTQRSVWGHKQTSNRSQRASVSGGWRLKTVLPHFYQHVLTVFTSCLKVMMGCHLSLLI